jgi:hypothetical protein
MKQEPFEMEEYLDKVFFCENSTVLLIIINKSTNSLRSNKNYKLVLGPPTKTSPRSNKNYKLVLGPPTKTSVSRRHITVLRTLRSKAKLVVVELVVVDIRGVVVLRS